MSRILVTGGAGFIGSHIVEHFHRTDEVIVLDNLRSGHRRNLEGFDVQLVEGGLTDAALLKRIVRGVDYVFHLAALVSVPESMFRPVECVEINAAGTLRLLEVAAEAGVKKLVLSSSAAIYGDDPVMPKREEMRPEPKSPYAVTKLDGEYYLKMYAAERGLPTVSLRYFNVFGPRQDPKSPYAAAVPLFIERALRNEDLVVFGDGEQTRDFVYVKDVVGANVFAARSDAAGVFNVARGGRMTVNDLAREIIRLTGSRSRIRHEAERPGDVKHSRADVSKLAAAGFTTSHDLGEGLAATVEWFRGKRG